MPVNLRTHAHGRGRTDSNDAMAELISRVRDRNGRCDAKIGDFGSAGGAKRNLFLPQNGGASHRACCWTTRTGVRRAPAYRSSGLVLPVLRAGRSGLRRYRPISAHSSRSSHTRLHELSRGRGRATGCGFDAPPRPKAGVPCDARPRGPGAKLASRTGVRYAQTPAPSQLTKRAKARGPRVLRFSAPHRRRSRRPTHGLGHDGGGRGEQTQHRLRAGRHPAGAIRAATRTAQRRGRRACARFVLMLAASV
jgi:hypothetical protein